MKNLIIFIFLITVVLNQNLFSNELSFGGYIRSYTGIILNDDNRTPLKLIKFPAVEF